MVVPGAAQHSAQQLHSPATSITNPQAHASAPRASTGAKVKHAGREAELLLDKAGI